VPLPDEGQGKAVALERGCYQSINMLEHVLKFFETIIAVQVREMVTIIAVQVREMVKIDNMQFGLIRGKGNIDATFIARQLQEKYITKKKGLWTAIVDLTKAIDRGDLVGIKVPKRG